MEILALFVIAVVTGKCYANIWNTGRPLYVIERFSLTDSNINNIKLPITNSGSSIPFEATPKVIVEPNSPSALDLTASPPESKSETSSLPKLVKPIPTEHKEMIRALHPPCHNTGCQKGSQCVYDRIWMCPTYIPELPCSCRPGCKVGTIFIPMGKTLTMDECGNECACLDENGEAVCTKRTCLTETDQKEAKMDSLLNYLKKLVNIKLQDIEQTPETTTPLQTSASGNVQPRKSTSTEINMARKIDFNTETRFPYSPQRLISFYVPT